MLGIEDIRAALMKALATFPSLPACAWPNEKFIPDPTVTWVRPTLMFAQANAAAIGVDAQNLQTGLFQVSVYVPANSGDGAAYALVAALCSYFKRGTQLVHGSVTVFCAHVWPAGPIEEPEWFQLPMTVRWQAYTDNA